MHTYDLQNRLISRTNADGTTNYEYDAAGNLVKETSSDGSVSYTYNAQNRLVKGELSDGESSSYVYNALGVRIENEQVRTNKNAGNQNAALTDGSHGVDYLDFLRDGRADWQRAWESEVGTTHQNDFETVTRHYIVDYLSEANRDIMVTEDGSYTTRYVYDENGKRISAEFGYADGTARATTNASGEYGENLQSDFATELHKVWYRTSLLNSTLFAVDANGDVVAHMIYDAWANPLVETYTDTNFSGLENLNNFTGYTWDETLGLYFAQNRFYDAAAHRFTQEDVVKDGANWYVYCGNNPTVWIDPWGLVSSTRYVCGNGVRMRSGAGTSYGILYVLNNNTSVTYLGSKVQANGYNWAKVQYNGEIGWIADKYLRIERDYSEEFEDLYEILKAQYPLLYVDVFQIRFSNVKNALLENKETIKSMAEKYEIPPEMIAAIIVKEQMTQSISDSTAYADTVLRGSAHSFGLGAIFPQTAYDAWRYLVKNNLTNTAFRDFEEKVYDPFYYGGYNIDDFATRNIVLGDKLAHNNEFNIETIAVVLRYNYELFKKGYYKYEKNYFNLFCCNGQNINRSSNTWLVENVYAGFTEEIYGHILSYYNTGNDYIYANSEGTAVRNNAGIKYGNYTREYLEDLRKIFR